MLSPSATPELLKVLRLPGRLTALARCEARRPLLSTLLPLPSTTAVIDAETMSAPVATVNSLVPRPVRLMALDAVEVMVPRTSSTVPRGLMPRIPSAAALSEADAANTYRVSSASMM